MSVRMLRMTALLTEFETFAFSQTAQKYAAHCATGRAMQANH